LIVLGTSLVVQPFASLTNKVGMNIPRLLINNEIVGDFKIQLDCRQLENIQQGRRQQDILHIGSCDVGVKNFVSE